MTSSNVAALPAGKGNFSLTPQTLDEAIRFADMLSKSSIVPKDYQGNPGNVVVAIQWGAEIGLPPLQAMQNIAVINGRPSIWGDAMLALVRASGLLVKHTEEESESAGTCTVQRRGEDPVTRTFTVEDAKRAGLWGKQGPWQTAPKRMMKLRARAFALRDVFPDVLRGVYVAEEAQDMPPERDMGQAEEVVKQPATRAESVRRALKDRRGEAHVVEHPLPTKSIDEVLAAIGAADTMGALQATTTLAEHLGEDEKKRARQAWKARKADLEPPALSFSKVADAIQKAGDADLLDAAADLIGGVADETQRAELAALYEARKAEIAK